MKNNTLMIRLVLATSVGAVLLGAYQFIQFRIGQDFLRSTALNATHTQPPAKRSTPVIGDLGGMPVSIPRNYIFMATEYEGDPFFLTPRKGPAAVRTAESKIASLSLFLQLPDFKPRLPENQDSFDKYFKTVGDVNWIMVGIDAGTGFNHRPEYLNDPFTNYSEQESKFYKVPHTLQAERVHGLFWEKAGALPFEESHPFNRDFYYRKVNGKITNFIECKVGPPRRPGGVKLCTHVYLLMPEMVARVSIDYPISLLPQWQEIEERSRAVILGFRTQPSIPRNPR